LGGLWWIRGSIRERSGVGGDLLPSHLQGHLDELGSCVDGQQATVKPGETPRQGMIDKGGGKRCGGCSVFTFSFS
jgi:hypothetical protein